MKTKENVEIRSIDKQELMDLLINKGVLQEVNRTFFNPVGLDLTLTEELKLKLMASENPNGVVQHTIDKNQIKIFNEYRYPRHMHRQKNLGFLIQTGDVIRKNLIEDNTLTSPSVLKLNFLLQCVDNIAYAVKKRFMEKSREYDSHLEKIDFTKIYRKTEGDMARAEYVDAIAKLVLLEYETQIEEKLAELRKIDAKQKKLGKGVK